MKNIYDYIYEAKSSIDYSKIDSELLDKLSYKDIEEISNDEIEDFISGLKKIDYKPLQDFLDITNILSETKEDFIENFNKYDKYHSKDKAAIKRITTISNQFDKLEKKFQTDYQDDILNVIDKVIAKMFIDLCDKNSKDIKSAKDVISAIMFSSVEEYFITDSENKDKSSMGVFSKWYEKCKDLATAGSFIYTKLSSSLRKDFKGLLDEYKANIHKIKLTDNQKVQTEFIDAILDKDLDKITEILNNDDNWRVFDPWVVQYVDKSGMSYVLNVCMLLAIDNINPSSNEISIEMVEKLTAKPFISYIKKFI